MRILHLFMLFTLFSFSETYVSKSIITSSFNKIDIDAPIDISINRADEREVSLQAEKNLITKIKIYVRGDTLFIRTKGSFRSKKGIKVTINNPHLIDCIVDGAATIKINGYSEDSFSLVVDGSSDIYFGLGSFNNFFLKADGSYTINLLGVDIKNAKIRAEGSGNIKVNVSNYLDIDLEGSVDAKYSGHPKIKKDIEDVSELTHI